MKMAALLLSAGLLISQSANAQYNRPFSVELHVGPAFPSDSVTDADIDDGGTFGASFTYYFLSNTLGVYAGFEGHAFEADSLDEPRLDSVFLYGYTLGIEYRGSIPPGGLGYFARFGTNFSKLKLLDDDNDEFRETSFDLGLETSAGLSYALGDSWELRGGIHYKTFSREFRRQPNNARKQDLDVTSISFGARFRF